MTRADLAAVILWTGATIYAVFGGADFGGGLWDLIAGDAEKGDRPRARIQRSLSPVWEMYGSWAHSVTGQNGHLHAGVITVGVSHSFGTRFVERAS